MAKKLVIVLDEDTTERYLAIASARLKAEVDECCEPSGERLIIEIGPTYLRSTVYGGLTELGHATTELLESDD